MLISRGCIPDSFSKEQELEVNSFQQGAAFHFVMGQQCQASSDEAEAT